MPAINLYSYAKQQMIEASRRLGIPFDDKNPDSPVYKAIAQYLTISEIERRLASEQTNDFLLRTYLETIAEAKPNKSSSISLEIYYFENKEVAIEGNNITTTNSLFLVKMPSLEEEAQEKLTEVNEKMDNIYQQATKLTKQIAQQESEVKKQMADIMKNNEQADMANSEEVYSKVVSAKGVVQKLTVIREDILGGNQDISSIKLKLLLQAFDKVSNSFNQIMQYRSAYAELALLKTNLIEILEESRIERDLDQDGIAVISSYNTFPSIKPAPAVDTNVEEDEEEVVYQRSSNFGGKK